jgi:hypothetical protein
MPSELGEGMAPRGVFLNCWEVGGLLYVKTRELRAVLNACSGLVSDQRVEDSAFGDLVNSNLTTESTEGTEAGNDKCLNGGEILTRRILMPPAQRLRRGHL